MHLFRVETNLLLAIVVLVSCAHAKPNDPTLAQVHSSGISSGLGGSSSSSSLSSSLCHGPEPSAELTELSGEDRELRDYVQQHIKSDFVKLDNIDEANRFFDRLRLLFRRHLINTAYARQEPRDLHEFLSQESTIQLVRFDNRPFVEPINDERLDKLQVYANESDLARKIYAKSIKKLIDVRNEMAAKKARGSDGAGVAREPPSFWANVWCKIANNCN